MTPIDGTLPLAAAEGGVSHRIGRLNVMKWRGWTALDVLQAAV